MREFSTLIDGLSFTECPRWRDGRLWISDFYTHRVLAISMDGSPETIAEVPEQPSGLGWLPDGRMLIVSMKDRRILRREHDGTLAGHADLFDLAPWHLNDMVVDVQGRAYVGNFGFDLMGGGAARTTNLIRVDPDGARTVAADDLGFPNGAVITPDGSTLIVAESFAGRLTAFSVASDGSLTDRRVWAQFGSPPSTTDVAEALAAAEVVPDGICLDAEGAIWVADAIHGRLIRVVEGGEIVEEIAGPMGLFACMLGGPDGRTLFACAAPTFAEHEASVDHRAAILMTTVDVPHAGLP
jgi:sugar lactone lactonase YvrE